MVPPGGEGRAGPSGRVARAGTCPARGKGERLGAGATPAAAGGTSRSVEGSRRPAAFLDRDPQLGGLRAAAGIADVAAFLVSSRAGGVSGAVVRVEG